MGPLSLIIEAPHLLGGTGNGAKPLSGGRPELLVSAFKVIQSAGPAGLLATPSPAFVSALGMMTPGERPELLALVPNVTEYLRDATETGLIGAAVKRLRRANLGVLFRLIRHGVTHAPRIVSYDFAALVMILLELELAGFRGYRPSSIVLAAPLTDLALAAGNRDFFRFYASYVRKRHQAKPCLETQNGGHLLARLRQWQVSIDAVVTAVNPKGFRMKPTKDACLTEMARATTRVFAREVTAGGTVPLDEGVAFAQTHGAKGLVIDLTPTENIADFKKCRALCQRD